MRDEHEGDADEAGAKAGARPMHRAMKTTLLALLFVASAGVCLHVACEPVGNMPAGGNAAAANANANGRVKTSANGAAASAALAAVTPAAEATVAAPGAKPEPAGAEGEGAAGGRLLVPVAGVRPEDLRDTYTQSRSEGRVHNAIDIKAPRGTPVLAAADGPIVKLFQSVAGGVTVYQLSTDNRTILYYAHLDRYADGLAEGHFARRGETIGYVGDTGNAGAGNYHLHFSVSHTDDPKRWWGGTNVNPYPLLVGGRGPGAGGQ